MIFLYDMKRKCTNKCVCTKYVFVYCIHAMTTVNAVPNIIVGFSFGKCHKQSYPNGTNGGLAWSVAAHLRQFKKCNKKRPILCLQEEIADAFVNHGFGKLHANDHVIQSRTRDGKYVSTSMVYREAIRLIKNMHHVIVVAHPDHAPRCMRIIRESGHQPIRTRYLQPLGGGIPWTRFGCDRRGYSQESTQPWTRTRRKFLQHEARLHTYTSCKRLH